MKRTSDKRRQSTVRMRAGRPLLAARADGNCERCGQVFRGEFEDHHRLLRSRGGGDELSNRVALCGECHRWVHANPLTATAGGWMLTASEEASQSLVYLRDWPCLLDNEGGFEELVDE